MRLYKVESPGNPLAGMASGILILLVSLFSPLGLIPVNGRSRATTGNDFFLVVWAFLFGSMGLYLAWRCAARSPYQIMVADDGRIEFKSLLCTVTIQRHEIKSIEKAIDKGGHGSPDTREIRVAYSGGCVSLPCFEEADEFIEGLMSRTPGIAMTDGWTE